MKIMDFDAAKFRWINDAPPKSLLLAYLANMGFRYKGYESRRFDEHMRFVEQQQYTHVKHGGETLPLTTETCFHLLKKMGMEPITYSGKITGKKNMGSCQCGSFQWSVEWTEYGENVLCSNTNWGHKEIVPYVGTAIQIISEYYLIPLK